MKNGSNVQIYVLKDNVEVSDWKQLSETVSDQYFMGYPISAVLLAPIEHNRPIKTFDLTISKYSQSMYVTEILESDDTFIVAKTVDDNRYLIKTI